MTQKNAKGAKKTFSRPRIVSREKIEAVAGSCNKTTDTCGGTGPDPS